jgi:uncharacterized protein
MIGGSQVMQSIVSKGKDVNEAINIGLEILETTKNDVDIEIIQSNTKGFLGINPKKAIVKLTKNKSKQNDSITLENIVDNLDSVDQPLLEKKVNKTLSEEDPIKEGPEQDRNAGNVWVKDGKIYCKSSPTHFPMVTIHEGIKLFKNNQLMKEKTTIVSEANSYEIRVENEEIETKWKVTLDQNKLKALLQVEPGVKKIRHIPDVQADHHIELNMVEKTEVINTLTFPDIIKKLELLGVKHGFNQAEMVKAIEMTKSGTYEIATGIVPKTGVDGWAELKVAVETDLGPKEKEDGRVDFREIKSIPAVEEGMIIAVIHPPVPGQIGYTVTNEPLPAKQTLPLVVVAGKGVIVVDDKIVATESGRPQIEQRGQLFKVEIMPKLIHNGNVDLSSGNLRFKGDIEVFGEVEQKMLVEARGDIFVRETVNLATLTASGAIITYGNIIGSEVSAGKSNMLVVELGHLLGVINQNVEKIIEVIQRLTLSPAFKSSDFSRGGLQPLIQILLEKKFRALPPLIRKYVEVVRKGESYLDDDVWREISVSLSKLFLSLTNEITSIEWMILLSKKMKDLHEFSSTSVEPNSFITIPHAINSRLYSSGNIIVVGQGCINTKIHAGGTLKINGIVRGGEIYGRLGVDVNEAGADSGTTTVIAVPSDQKIKINKAMEGTVIQIGDIKHKIKDTTYHITARIDENDRIIFE